MQDRPKKINVGAKQPEPRDILQIEQEENPLLPEDDGLLDAIARNQFIKQSTVLDSLFFWDNTRQLSLVADMLQQVEKDQVRQLSKDKVDQLKSVLVHTYALLKNKYENTQLQRLMKLFLTPTHGFQRLSTNQLEYIAEHIQYSARVVVVKNENAEEEEEKERQFVAFYDDEGARIEIIQINPENKKQWLTRKSNEQTRRSFVVLSQERRPRDQ